MRPPPPDGGRGVALKASVRRCSVLGWTERQGKKALLYRAGLEFEASSREVLQILGPKIPPLLEKNQPDASHHAGPKPEDAADIEVIIEEP